jgi:hypothetical protein
MREAILRVDRRGLLWTISRMFSSVLIFRTISLSDCTATHGRQPVSRNVWLIRVKTPYRRNPSVGITPLVFFNSSMCTAVANPYTKCMLQYSTWENIKGISATPTRNKPFVMHAHYHWTAWIQSQGHELHHVTCQLCWLQYAVFGTARSPHFSLALISVTVQLWI